MTSAKYQPAIHRPIKCYVRPGEHSHNARRRVQESALTNSFIRLLRVLLLIGGLSCTGYYVYSVCHQYVYQSYENWAFDQQIAGFRHVTFTDYVLEQTPLRFVFGTKAPAAPTPVSPSVAQRQPKPDTVAALPAEGTVLGRIEIKRLRLSAMVRQGVDAKTLSLAVGHVPFTALPGQVGNFAIAAHRDTLFRGLKDIKKGDLVTFEAPNGTFTYRVLATKIVKPTEVAVLQADGGGLIPSTSAGTPDHLLTMITCYPFYYVGSAPRRFIVQAKLVDQSTAHCYTCG